MEKWLSHDNGGALIFGGVTALMVPPGCGQSVIRIVALRTGQASRALNPSSCPSLRHDGRSGGAWPIAPAASPSGATGVAEIDAMPFQPKQQGRDGAQRPALSNSERAARDTAVRQDRAENRGDALTYDAEHPCRRRCG